MYKVIHKFADAQDNNYIYEVGDVYPHEGKEVSDERIAELVSNANKIGKSVIEQVAEKKPKKKAEPKIDEAEVASETIKAE